jgi:hypothetical protein
MWIPTNYTILWLPPLIARCNPDLIRHYCPSLPNRTKAAKFFPDELIDQLLTQVKKQRRRIGVGKAAQEVTGRRTPTSSRNRGCPSSSGGHNHRNGSSGKTVSLRHPENCDWTFCATDWQPLSRNWSPNTSAACLGLTTTCSACMHVARACVKSGRICWSSTSWKSRLI